MKIIIFDTETTGLPLPLAAPLEKQPKIIELGLVIVENGEAVETHNWLVNPGEQITEQITKITGITNEELVDQPRFVDIAERVSAIFADADIAIAHNAPFDTKLVNFEYARLGVEFKWPPEIICTVQEFKHVIGKRPKLTELYQHFVGQELAQTHRAIDDAMALFDAIKAANFFEMLEPTEESNDDSTTQNSD